MASHDAVLGEMGSIAFWTLLSAPHPRRLRSADGVVLLGEPSRVDDDVVLHIAPRVGRGLPRDSGYCATHVDIAAYDHGEVAS